MKSKLSPVTIYLCVCVSIRTSHAILHGKGELLQMIDVGSIYLSLRKLMAQKDSQNVMIIIIRIIRLLVYITSWLLYTNMVLCVCV